MPPKPAKGRGTREGLLPSHIPNKIKRAEVHAKQKKEKKKEKKERRKKREREAEALGEDAPPKQKPKTLESTREKDDTIVEADDEEVLGDVAMDEFSKYFAGEETPKILITTSRRASSGMYTFISELLDVFPNSDFLQRENREIKDIVKKATDKKFTNLMIINEDNKKPNGIVMIHLPDGPTAHFKLTNVKLRKQIRGHGNPTEHAPEIILNNFNTRLGHTVGRFLASLVPQQPEFKGRRVVTFHNQRDFIFFRHHRYIFDSATKSRIQELGPRFTLKLRSLQKGTFDSKQGEYEWYWKADMATSRRRFFM
eukprot:TRINITY_DN448_c0_g1_i4.p1 TRINITY_DN448_c0_g1~~TRINITY_DN448_c0_g1_i4.p1  ORF type:complete len:311 (+),score=50.72 TRINITY_DN448_c0_g1_i4:130-1062(+)